MSPTIIAIVVGLVVALAANALLRSLEDRPVASSRGRRPPPWGDEVPDSRGLVVMGLERLPEEHRAGVRRSILDAANIPPAEDDEPSLPPPAWRAIDADIFVTTFADDLYKIEARAVDGTELAVYRALVEEPYRVEVYVAVHGTSWRLLTNAGEVIAQADYLRPGFVEVSAIGDDSPSYLSTSTDETPTRAALESILDYAIGFAVGSLYDVTKTRTVVVEGELYQRIFDSCRLHLGILERDLEVGDDVRRCRARLRVALERAVLADQALTIEEGLDLYVRHPELVDALHGLKVARDDLREAIGLDLK